MKIIYVLSSEVGGEIMRGTEREVAREILGYDGHRWRVTRSKRDLTLTLYRTHRSTASYGGDGGFVNVGGGYRDWKSLYEHVTVTAGDFSRGLDVLTAESFDAFDAAE